MLHFVLDPFLYNSFIRDGTLKYEDPRTYVNTNSDVDLRPGDSVCAVLCDGIGVDHEVSKNHCMLITKTVTDEVCAKAILITNNWSTVCLTITRGAILHDIIRYSQIQHERCYILYNLFFTFVNEKKHNQVVIQCDDDNDNDDNSKQLYHLRI